jgi:cytochrome bd-type quinol oxidase subunit 2
MTDGELRNYLGVLSFLLAALSFLATERRAAIESLHERSDVSKAEKWATFGSVLLLTLAAVGLVLSAWPAVSATALRPDDLLRLHTAVREAFVMGWVLLAAITLALGALLWRAREVRTSARASE